MGSHAIGRRHETLLIQDSPVLVPSATPCPAGIGGFSRDGLPDGLNPSELWSNSYRAGTLALKVKDVAAIFVSSCLTDSRPVVAWSVAR